MSDWVEVDACTLPTAERSLRLSEFDAFFSAALRGVERPEPGRLRLVLDEGSEAEARELTARESSCCSFFDFRFVPAGGRLMLDVRVPEARIDVLDGLAWHAASRVAP